MPIYEYRCGSCEETVEKLQRMNDAPLTDCPACGASALKRLVSAASFRLKGGGWYETDFKQGNKRNLADGSDGGSNGEAKSEGKKEGGKNGEQKAAASSDGKSGEAKAKKASKSSDTKSSA